LLGHVKQWIFSSNTETGRLVHHCLESLYILVSLSLMENEYTSRLVPLGKKTTAEQVGYI